jgi:hypothetical protein
MRHLRAIFVLILFFNASFTMTHANEALLDHVLNVSKTISALYMLGLSEGSEKYQLELQSHKKKSIRSIKRYFSQGSIDSSSLLKRWQALSPQLNLAYSKTYGWELSPNPMVRFKLRQYHSDIYQLLEKNQRLFSSPSLRLRLVAAQIEVISARFYDIASTYDGAESLSNRDFESINPQLISIEIKQQLKMLSHLTQDKKIEDQINSVKYKWSFVENTLVNHQEKSAYFLVYATKTTLDKTLSSINLKSH